MAVEWCTCNKARNTGWTHDRESGHWVCAKCRKVAKMVWEKTHARSDE